MELDKKFSDDELVQIIEEAMLYTCACPGQVAAEIRRLRDLFAYQQRCEREPGSNLPTHQAIAQAAMEAHGVLETCLEEVLLIEGWDRQRLKMPPGLRRQQTGLLRP